MKDLLSERKKKKNKGLWYNIHKRRAQGKRPLRPGEKGYPKTLDIGEGKTMKLTVEQLRNIVNEEVAHAMGKDSERFLHGFESGHPMDDEGYMVKSRMSDIKSIAETVCNLLNAGDQLPAWVQDLVASAHTDLEHVKDYLENDEKMRSHGKHEASFSAKPEELAFESKNIRGGMLLEGHARITPEEMSAWMNGDWGYVAENTTGMGVYEEEDVCKTCGEKISDEEMKSHSHECGSFYK